MESRKSIEDFLKEVDEDLLIYAAELRSNGFTSTTSAKYLTEKDLTGIPDGHKRLILNMASRLRTPVRNLERPKTVFLLSSEKSPASKSPARKKTALCVGETGVEQEPQTSQREASISRPTIRRKLLSPGERFIEEKRHALYRFQTCGQKLRKFLSTKEKVCMRKEFNPHRVFHVHQHGRFLIVLCTNVAAVTSCENHL